LVDFFVKKYCDLYQKELFDISFETMSKLNSYNWPGNVRQLENLIKQVVVRGDESIVIELLANNMMAASNQMDSSQNLLEEEPIDDELANTYSLKKRVGHAVAREEKKLISRVLNKTNWNRRKAAELLEISYRSLLYKIKEYELNTTK